MLNEMFDAGKKIDSVEISVYKSFIIHEQIPFA